MTEESWPKTKKGRIDQGGLIKSGPSTCRAVLCAGLAFALLSTPSWSQEPDVALATLTGCLSDAEDRASIRACMGVYARPCTESANVEGRALLTDCVTAETAAWDRSLDEVFAETVVLARDRMALAELAGDRPMELDELLRAAQGDWVKFRDADCTQEAAGAESDDALLASVWCRLDRTTQRFLEMREKREALSPE